MCVGVVPTIVMMTYGIDYFFVRLRRLELGIAKSTHDLITQCVVLPHRGNKPRVTLRGRLHHHRAFLTDRRPSRSEKCFTQSQRAQRRTSISPNAPFTLLHGVKGASKVARNTFYPAEPGMAHDRVEAVERALSILEAFSEARS